MSHPFIPVPNVASVEVIYNLQGVTAENTFHVQKGSPFTLAQLQALRGTVNAWDSATWAGVRGPSCTLQRIRTKALDTSSSPTEDYNLPAPRPGTQGGSPMANSATIAIKLSTGRAGRSYRGRVYVAGLTSNYYATNPNVLQGSSVGFIVAALTALQTALTAAGYTLGVVSYRADKAWRAEGVFTAALGWVAVDNNLDCMRRRLVGRGI